MKRVLISGSSGLVGTLLMPALRSSGYSILRLVRRPAAAADEVSWSPTENRIETSKLEGISAVVNLAGEDIASGTWTEKRKKEIWESRVMGTRLLAASVMSLKAKPEVFVSASAIGYYGNRGDELCSESTSPGQGFLPALAKEWEEAALIAAHAGIRVVLPRLGIVLAKNGGALQKMLPPFRLGLGGPLGSGKQFMSWIEINDLIRLLVQLVEDSAYSGVVNCVSPNPVTNAEFSKTLGKVLRRPAFMRVPAFVLRIALGSMAEEVLLSSTKVAPEVLSQRNFSFAFPQLEAALRNQLEAV